MMKITRDVRDYAATLNDPSLNPHPEEAQRAVSKDEAEAGMAAMSEKFKTLGEQVYVDAEKVKESNKAL
jgi:phosphomethylpyrimidine synthase